MAKKTAKLRPLQRFSLYFFRRPRQTAILALAVTLFGLLSYTTLLKREGFPAINIPYGIGQAAYFVNDPQQVDAKLAKPASEFLLKQKGVKTVQTNSLANFATMFVQYEDGIDSSARSKQLQVALSKNDILPKDAEVKFESAQVGFTERGDDAVVSFYDQQNPTKAEPELAADAKKAADFIKKEAGPIVQSAAIIDPSEEATNPMTGESQTVQNRFERFGLRKEGRTQFFSSVPIGLSIKDGSDVIKFGDAVEKAVEKYNAAQLDSGRRMEVSASYAPGIKQQISELQRTLLEGLLAVLVIGSLVIAVRASFVTVLSMVTVLLVTLGLLEVIGYTLNTITLFGLVLSLSLIVDDTIIVVEAIDAQRKRKTDAEDIVKTAVRKVGRAMIAATSTAALSFAPLLFVGGVIGEFVRTLPVTIIAALVVSLLVALIFIPLFARFVLIGKKHVGKHAEHEIAEDIERKIAEKLSAPMLWAQHSKLKIGLVTTAALMISFLFIGGSFLVMSKVKINIFPPTKDTNQLRVSMQFMPGTTMVQAEEISDRATKVISKTLGSDFRYAANYGAGNTQSADFFVELTDYTKREKTGPDYIEDLEKNFKNFAGAKVSASSIDVGPPAANFVAEIKADKNPQAAQKLSADIADFLKKSSIKRADGSKIIFEDIQASNPDVVLRKDGKASASTTATFKDDDTTYLITQTQAAVEKQFDEKRVASYGLPKDALGFDFGQEQDNMDSFKTLALAFPAILAIIYVVLAVQFRSILQPLLIVMAIPFSLFGVTMGLWLTDNAFSFFAMLGFFALIGLSIKNTILLTDYANQSRRAGMNPVDAVHEALAERFRPLIATSLTAIVSIIPLALTSPFWQGLAVVLIFGLLSSTFLVVTVYPYYYLAGEYVRGVFRRGWRRLRTSLVRS